MTTNSTSTAGRVQAVVLDCARPTALAGFYRGLLGGEITESDDDYAALTADGVALAFQRVPDDGAPAWAGGGRRVHLDVVVPDVEAGRKRLAELGAVEAEFQPGGGDWTVFLDPEGHPFCLMAAG
jgi:catechol-2,3-dioxygenase